MHTLIGRPTTSVDPRTDPYPAVADGSVLVGAVTDSAESTDSGNIPAALALVKSHLHKVEVRLR
jgi:hypothetical protein